MTDYLQVLVVERRGDDIRRLHLRFATGDDSYNYFVDGRVHVGLFQSPDEVREAKEMLSRHAAGLVSVLTPSTLTEAALRTEDSAAFMADLLKTGRITAGSDSGCAYFLSVALAKPDGDVLCGRFEATASDELPEGVADLLSDCMAVADSLV